MGFVRARWPVAGAVLLLLALAPGFRLWQHFHPSHPLHAGDRLAPIALSSLSGAPATLAPDGRAHVLAIFTTWCDPCRREMIAFGAATAQLRAAGIDLIGIDQQENRSQVMRFAQQFKLTYPLYIDDTGITHRVLGARVIPTTIFIDAAGIIRWTHVGPMTVRELLAVKPIGNWTV